MKLIDEITKHSARKMALLVRHGDREQIPIGEFGNEILLNERGQRRSIEFGERLKQFPVVKIYTSPIPRCVQTAQLMVQGFGKKLDIVQTKCLGDPGLHTLDEKIAGDFYLQHGFHEMLRRFVRKEDVPGVPNIDQLRVTMTDFISKSADQDGLTVFVTHDSLIAMFHHCIDGTIYTLENWVDYLEGMIYKIEDQEE